MLSSPPKEDWCDHIFKSLHNLPSSSHMSHLDSVIYISRTIVHATLSGHPVLLTSPLLVIRPFSIVPTTYNIISSLYLGQLVSKYKRWPIQPFSMAYMTFQHYLNPLFLLMSSPTLGEDNIIIFNSLHDLPISFHLPHQGHIIFISLKKINAVASI